MTNAQRIRGMSDGELAAIIVADFTEEKLNYCQNKPECGADYLRYFVLCSEAVCWA